VKIRGLAIICDRDAFRNRDWFLNNVVLPGGYTHLVAGLSYRFQRRPELSRLKGEFETCVPLERNELVELQCCVKQSGVDFIPLIPLWGYNLITPVHPELAENPAVPKAYCPRNPATRALVGDMLDEIIELLRPQYLHVGLDEINESHLPYDNYKSVDQIGVCSLCRADTPADVFAEEVNRLNRYLRDKRCTMMMWGDQLLNAPDFFDVYERDGNYGEYTYQAADKIDKDVLICDWHYGEHSRYPSIDYFVRKGFRVLGCPSVYNSGNITGFTDYVGKKGNRAQLPGMLMTFWGKAALRSEAENDFRYGFVDDRKNLEALLLAGRCFQGK